jgi:N-acetylglucosamine malate deacetylase 1
MTVLVIAPHPDDEAIGCGGAMLNHAAKGDRVVVVFLTSGELGLKPLAAADAQRIRESEAAKAAAILGTASTLFLRLPDWSCGDDVHAAARVLLPVLGTERPALIYLPHPGDDHPDHRACLTILQAALESVPGPVPQLRGYEVWSPLPTWHQVEDITTIMDRKLAAIGAYRSQIEQFRYDRAAAGLNQYRGALFGRCDYAEVFSQLDARPATDH